MNEHLIARSVSERMFSRQFATVEKLLVNSSSSVSMIERHRAVLSARWTVLQEKHDTYVIQNINDSIEMSANDCLIDKYSSEFIRINTDCDNFISSCSADKSAACTATSITNSIKLERVKFRTFDGKMRGYPKFKQEFETYVQPLCSPNQLPFILKSYLCDSVRREVEHIDHDVTAMWERLDEKYGSIQKQIDCILNDFKNLPACENVASTMNMISVVESAVADMKCLSASDQLENALIISAIEESMSKLMLDNWAERIATDKDRHCSATKFMKLMEFLRYWRWMTEYNNANIRNSCASPITETAARKCLVHRDADHPVWRCRAFKVMSANERHNIIKLSNACTLCLEKGHCSANCKVSFRCSSPNCNSEHNILLHGLICGGGTV